MTTDTAPSSTARHTATGLLATIVAAIASSYGLPEAAALALGTVASGVVGAVLRLFRKD